MSVQTNTNKNILNNLYLSSFSKLKHINMTKNIMSGKKEKKNETHQFESSKK